MDYWTGKAARPAQLEENVLIPRKVLSCFYNHTKPALKGLSLYCPASLCYLHLKEKLPVTARSSAQQNLNAKVKQVQAPFSLVKTRPVATSKEPKQRL